MRTINVLEYNNETTCFKLTINSRMNPIVNDADVKRACVASLLNDQMYDHMHISPSEDDSTNYGNDTVIVVTNSKTKIRHLIADEIAHIYAERTQAEIQVQIEEGLAHMLQLGKNAVSNGIKTVPARFLETKMIELISRGATDEAMSECFERWSPLDTFLTAVVKRRVSSQLFIWPVAGFNQAASDSNHRQMSHDAALCKDGRGR